MTVRRAILPVIDGASRHAQTGYPVCETTDGTTLYRKLAVPEAAQQGHALSCQPKIPH